MFVETMRAAIAGARTLAQLDELSRDTWRAHAGGAVDDDGAQSLAEQLHARRLVVRGDIRPVGIPSGRASLFPPRRPTTSPDRLVSRDRRRLLAASGPMPPQLAARFTTGQLAVLRIVGDEVAAKGVCGLCIDAIAARAGVCRRLAQAAIRLAEGDGLVTIQERRHEGRKSDPNLVRILSQEWLAWLRRGRPSPRPGPTEAAPVLKGGGCKPLRPTDKSSDPRGLRAVRDNGVASPQRSSLAPAAHAPGGGAAPHPARGAASGTGRNAAEGQRLVSAPRPIRNRNG